MTPRIDAVLAAIEDKNEPSDTVDNLFGIITRDDLLSLIRCGGGGFGDVFVLSHRTLGRIALKRVRESGTEEEITDER